MRSRCERMASQREASHLVCAPLQGFKARSLMQNSRSTIIAEAPQERHGYR